MIPLQLRRTSPLIIIEFGVGRLSIKPIIRLGSFNARSLYSPIERFHVFPLSAKVQ